MKNSPPKPRATFIHVCLLVWLGSAAVYAQQPQVRQAELAATAANTRRVAAGASFTFVPPLAKPEPFLALGATWEAAPETRLSLRASTDGVTWGEWFELTANQDNANEQLTPKQVSNLVLLDARTIRLECKLARGVSLNNLRFIFISPGATSRAMQASIQSKAMSQQPPSAKYPKPSVITRTEWGCPDGQITTHGALSYTTVTHLIVHHTATGNTPPAANDWAAVVRSIWNFHIFTNGWADIGYNYLVDPNGVVYEGRAGGDNVLGAHFSGVNGGTLGISMIGTFTDVAPSAKALNSLRRILAWKADQRGIDPTSKARHAASGLELNNISGHRDGPGSTECPGNALYPLLTDLRANVKELLTGSASVASVSAASFTGEALAREAIVAAFGAELATTAQAATPGAPLPTSLAGTTVVVRDSAQVERFAPLFFVSPGQVNYQIPAGTALGLASVLITNQSGRLSSGTIKLEAVAPALFTANSDGRGVPAAVVLRSKADGTQSYESVTVFDAAQNRFASAPIDLGSPNEEVFLVAFGTGVRYHSGLTAVTAIIGGVDAAVLFAGAVEGLAGLDQVNVRLPRNLAGRGEVELKLTVEGKLANEVRLRIK